MTQDYINHLRKMGNSTTKYEQNYKGAKSYYDAELLQILKYVNKNLPVLEIGSGFGYLAKYLTEYVCDRGGEKNLKIFLVLIPPRAYLKKLKAG